MDLVELSVLVTKKVILGAVFAGGLPEHAVAQLAGSGPFYVTSWNVVFDFA